jgi:hypothetical protein
MDIRYLALRAEDALLILGVKAGSTIRLPVTGQRKKTLLWIRANGSFSDGSVIRFKGANFFPSDPEPSGAQKYQVYITVGGPEVTFRVTQPDGTQARLYRETDRP